MLINSCKECFYDLPKNYFKSKRSAGLGIGTKYDFTRTSKNTPGPNHYMIKRTLSQNTHTFGLGRDVDCRLMNQQVAIDGIKQGKGPSVNGPSPVSYRLPSAKSTIGYSFRIRTQSLSSKGNDPGPGHYWDAERQSTISKTGIYPTSKFRSSGAPKIGGIHLNEGKATSTFFVLFLRENNSGSLGLQGC